MARTPGDDDEDPSRALILARRNRLIALAIVGATTVTSATACACLSVVRDFDAGPDAGSDAATDAATDSGASDAGDSGS